jgi:hypothetical protein
MGKWLLRTFDYLQCALLRYRGAVLRRRLPGTGQRRLPIHRRHSAPAPGANSRHSRLSGGLLAQRQREVVPRLFGRLGCGYVHRYASPPSIRQSTAIQLPVGVLQGCVCRTDHELLHREHGQSTHGVPVQGAHGQAYIHPVHRAHGQAVVFPDDIDPVQGAHKQADVDPVHRAN